MRYLILSIVLFLMVGTAHADRDRRFTAGWKKQYHDGWHSNLLTTIFKVSSVSSLFTFSLGLSKPREEDSQLASGEIAAEILDIVSVDIIQKYTLSKVTKQKLFIAQLGYEYYYDVWEKDWWKIKLKYYVSAGIMGHVQLRTMISKYNWYIEITEEEKLDDYINLPNGIVGSSVDFSVPVCSNLEMGIATLRLCPTFNIENPKASMVGGSISFGI